MYSISKKYTSEGRDRFGSSIFINDIEEDIVDTLSASSRDQSVLIVLFLLLVVKFLSANFLGIIFTIPLYYFMYFLSEKHASLSYTNHRVLVEIEYKNPRTMIVLGNILIITSIVIGMRTFIPLQMEFDILRLDGMYLIFQLLNVSNIIFFQYKSFFLSNSNMLILLDSLISVLINIWYICQYRLISYNFQEINYSHISEQLVKTKKSVRLTDMTVLIFFYLLFDIFYFQSFSLSLLLLFYIIFRLSPRAIVAEYSLFGPTGRNLVKNFEIKNSEFLRLHRTTGAIFGWEVKSIPENDFPSSLITFDVASYYTTGRQASYETAMKQANIIGGLISTIINIIVIISLYNFAIKFIPSAIETVHLLALGIMGFSIIIFILVHILYRLNLKLQSHEQLMIGQGFVARYIAPSLWIVRGNKLEGTTVRRGGSQPWIKYDKVNGLILQWRKLTIIAAFLIVIIALIIWNALGGLNITLLPYVFPSIIEFSLQFLQEKANAELSFFIIIGYILWGSILILYPQYYAQTRPSLYLDMEYATLSPVILKDFNEYLEASVQFTKALIHSSRPNVRNRIGRPGTIILGLDINDILIGEGTHLVIHAGDNMQSKQLQLPINTPANVFSRLITSGLRGFVRTNISLQLYNNTRLIWEHEYNVNILYSKNKLIDVDMGSYGYLQLEFSILAKKS